MADEVDETNAAQLPEPSSGATKPTQIEAEIDSFVKAIDSLFSSFVPTMWLMEAGQRTASDDMREFIKTKCHNVQVSDGLIQGELPPSLFAENARLQRKLNQRAIACKILARSFVVSLVSQYDSFLGGLVRALFFLKPELLNSSERALSFKELSQFSSLDDAREFI